MASKAYLKLMDRAICTINFSAGNLFDHTPPLDKKERIEFLMLRLARFKVRGYSREYVEQLVEEDMSLNLKSNKQEEEAKQCVSL